MGADFVSLCWRGDKVHKVIARTYAKGELWSSRRRLLRAFDARRIHSLLATGVFAAGTSGVDHLVHWTAESHDLRYERGGAGRKLWGSPDGQRMLEMSLSDLPEEEIERRNETEGGTRPVKT